MAEFASTKNPLKWCELVEYMYDRVLLVDDSEVVSFTIGSAGQSDAVGHQRRSSPATGVVAELPNDDSQG